MSILGEYVLSGQEINSNVVRSIDENNGGGSGGSSDYTEATVTLIPDISDDTANTTIFNAIFDENGYKIVREADAYDDYASSIGKVLLYKGESVIFSNCIVDMSGAIAPHESYEDVYIVTGDCTITLRYRRLQ